MVPTLGYKTVSNTLLFGPTHNRVLFPSGVPVTSPTNDGYPTRMAVRTDPAVSGDISRAELYLDVNRNGSLVMVNFIRTPAQPLDCSLEGLSSSLTWYADLPNPNFATQAQGKSRAKTPARAAAPATALRPALDTRTAPAAPD